MYGGQSYGERKLKFTFLIVESDRFDKNALYTQWTKTVNWLMGVNHKVKLKDDVMSDYYYLGEVQEALHGTSTFGTVSLPLSSSATHFGSMNWPKAMTFGTRLISN